MRPSTSALPVLGRAPSPSSLQCTTKQKRLIHPPGYLQPKATATPADVWSLHPWDKYTLIDTQLLIHTPGGEDIPFRIASIGLCCLIYLASILFYMVSVQEYQESQIAGPNQGSSPVWVILSLGHANDRHFPIASLYAKMAPTKHLFTSIARRA